MSCNHPNKSFWTGSFTESGKKDYYFCPGVSGDMVNVQRALKSGKIVTPSAPLLRVGSNTFLIEPLAIPCGVCVGCRMERAKQWKVRLCHECNDYPDDQVNFVTLTYDDEHLPVNECGEPYLKLQDLQDFLNRLRNPTIGVHRFYRYFACGEYGEAGHRPHFHLILFGKLDDLIPYRAPDACHSATIDKAWSKGLTDVSPVHPNKIAYVAGYVEKKQKDPFWNDYPVKPFITMSTRPMIGHSYLSKIDGRTRYVYGDFGKVRQSSIPRAYLKKLDQKEWFEAFKAESVRLAKKALVNNLGAVRSTDQEKLGNVKDIAAFNRLEKVRNQNL